MNNMDKMLGLLSQKLGISNETIKGAINSGDVSKLLSGMQTEEAKRLQRLIKDKERLEALVKSKEAMNLMKQMRR
ncbi:MAG: hypothetical protein LBR74_03805 [Eubacterium sp.]|nr:hypothetical protein [Eubacterium sp.]